jgi:hypothetical protein
VRTRRVEQWPPLRRGKFTRAEEAMHAKPIAIRVCLGLCSAALLTLPASSSAVDVSALPAARLTVLPDRYVLDGRQYFDGAALEAAVQDAGVRTIRIDNCADASSPRLLATVARFNLFALDVRLLDADAAACRAPALVPAAVPARSGGTEMLDLAQTARYWRQLEP